MKKKTLVIIILLISLCFTGCAKKTPLSVDKFKNEMKKADYAVEDMTSEFSEYDYIKSVNIALKNTYQIEFYQFDSENNAIKFFENNKKIFEKSKSISSIETNNSISNHSKYTLNSDGKYKVVSRIDDTVIYLDADENFKEEIKNILKKIDY